MNVVVWGPISVWFVGGIGQIEPWAQCVMLSTVLTSEICGFRKKCSKRDKPVNSKRQNSRFPRILWTWIRNFCQIILQWRMIAADFFVSANSIIVPNVRLSIVIRCRKLTSSALWLVWSAVCILGFTSCCILNLLHFFINLMHIQ